MASDMVFVWHGGPAARVKGYRVHLRTGIGMNWTHNRYPTSTYLFNEKNGGTL